MILLILLMLILVIPYAGLRKQENSVCLPITPSLLSHAIAAAGESTGHPDRLRFCGLWWLYALQVSVTQESCSKLMPRLAACAVIGLSIDSHV